MMAYPPRDQNQGPRLPEIGPEIPDAIPAPGLRDWMHDNLPRYRNIVHFDFDAQNGKLDGHRAVIPGVEAMY